MAFSFGTPAPGAPAFGASPAAPAPAFGAAPVAPAAPAFGAAPAPAFGAAPAPAPAAGGFGFGAPAPAPAPAAGGFGLAPTAAPATTLGFGAPAPAPGGLNFGAAPAPAPAAGGFGFSLGPTTPAAPAPAPAAGGFGFGLKPTTPGPAAPAAGGSGFGLTPAPALGAAPAPATGGLGFSLGGAPALAGAAGGLGSAVTAPGTAVLAQQDSVKSYLQKTAAKLGYQPKLAQPATAPAPALAGSFGAPAQAPAAPSATKAQPGWAAHDRRGRPWQNKCDAGLKDYRRFMQPWLPRPHPHDNPPPSFVGAFGSIRATAPAAPAPVSAWGAPAPPAQPTMAMAADETTQNNWKEALASDVLRHYEQHAKKMEKHSLNAAASLQYEPVVVTGFRELSERIHGPKDKGLGLAESNFANHDAVLGKLEEVFVALEGGSDGSGSARSDATGSKSTHYCPHIKQLELTAGVHNHADTTAQLQAPTSASQSQSSQVHDLHTLLRDLEQAEERITARTIEVMATVAGRRSSSEGLSREEEAMSEKLRLIESRLRKPGDGHAYRARVSALKALVRADRAAGMRENRGIGRLDVHTAACVREALAQQREVIAELVKRVEKDMRDMRIMMKHLPELDSEKWHQGKNYS